MIRKAVSKSIKSNLEEIEKLEQERAKLYGYQVTLNIDERAGYENLTRSIMHYEGRVKEARAVLRMIDELEVRVTASECDHCGHHEIGYQDHYTKFHALRPGQWILVRNA